MGPHGPLGCTPSREGCRDWVSTSMLLRVLVSSMLVRVLCLCFTKLHAWSCIPFNRPFDDMPCRSGAISSSQQVFANVQIFLADDYLLRRLRGIKSLAFSSSSHVVQTPTKVANIRTIDDSDSRKSWPRRRMYMTSIKGEICTNQPRLFVY